jgi:hypothetical protein
MHMRQYAAMPAADAGGCPGRRFAQVSTPLWQRSDSTSSAGKAYPTSASAAAISAGSAGGARTAALAGANRASHASIRVHASTTALMPAP